jgi:probable rRNA maturation factor
VIIEADPSIVPASFVADVQIACRSDGMPATRDIELWAWRAYCGAVDDADGEVEVSVRVVTKDEIRELNRDYRAKDKATNVLSFPAGNVAGLPADAVRTLGDVVICADVVREEAAQQGKTVENHWAHMLVHGVLHLLGFDHVTDAEAGRMEDLEKQVLAAHGVPDPYRAR